jgi:hypothetical protein
MAERDKRAQGANEEKGSRTAGGAEGDAEKARRDVEEQGRSRRAGEARGDEKGNERFDEGGGI